MTCRAFILIGNPYETRAPSPGTKLLRWLRLHTWDRRARQPLTLDPALREAQLLQTVYSMRQELSELWSRSGASRSATADQLLEQLCEWRARAEASGIAALREFARRLPNLVVSQTRTPARE